jgi:hypothetical protein
MVINFLVALWMVHVGLPFSANIAPLSMLALAVFFGLHGAGRWSIDSFLFPSPGMSPPDQGSTSRGPEKRLCRRSIQETDGRSGTVGKRSPPSGGSNRLFREADEGGSGASTSPSKIDFR